MAVHVEVVVRGGRHAEVLFDQDRIVQVLDVPHERSRVALRAGFLERARVLDGQESFGTVTPGKLADLVVIEGDLTSDPALIQNVTIVFKEGVGYDPEKLLESVRGVVGLR